MGRFVEPQFHIFFRAAQDTFAQANTPWVNKEVFPSTTPGSHQTHMRGLSPPFRKQARTGLGTLTPAQAESIVRPRGAVSYLPATIYEPSQRTDAAPDLLRSGSDRGLVDEKSQHSIVGYFVAFRGLGCTGVVVGRRNR